MANGKKSTLNLERFRDYLRRLARSLVRTDLRRQVDASDIVQETFLEAWRHRDQVRARTDPQLAAWLKAILHNKLRHIVRDLGRDKRDIGREIPIDSLPGGSSSGNGGGLPAADLTPSARMGREERAEALAEMLAELPEAQLQALVTRYLDGMRIAEIAASMQRSPLAVMALLRRGLQRLREVAAMRTNGTSVSTREWEL